VLPVDPDLPDRPPVSPAVLAVIAAGGMLGASARYGVSRWLATPAGGHLPWATFWTNVSGSFVLGLLAAVVIQRAGTHPLLRLFLTTGLLGAFTTMSTYEVETALLLKDGHTATALVYGLGTVAAGLLAVAVGLRVGRRSRYAPR
jgi:CrcB protein